MSYNNGNLSNYVYCCHRGPNSSRCFFPSLFSFPLFHVHFLILFFISLVFSFVVVSTRSLVVHDLLFSFFPFLSFIFFLLFCFFSSGVVFFYCCHGKQNTPQPFFLFFFPHYKLNTSHAINCTLAPNCFSLLQENTTKTTQILQCKS